MSEEIVPEIKLDLNEKPTDMFARHVLIHEQSDAGDRKLLRIGGAPRFHSHQEILDLFFENEGAIGATYVCDGGGRMMIDPTQKRIYIWEYSADFGEEPDREGTTVAILRRQYPDWNILCSEPNEGGRTMFFAFKF